MTIFDRLKSDYYAQEQGVWGGKGAERLALKGEVTREEFLALASNPGASGPPGICPARLSSFIAGQPADLRAANSGR